MKKVSEKVKIFGENIVSIYRGSYMRFIEWDEELKKQIKESYLNLHWDRVYETNQTIGIDYGNVAEALVQKYYNKPIHYCGVQPDNGYDLVLTDTDGNDFTVDVKNHCNNVKWFESPNNFWSVANYRKVHADVYLFTELDYIEKKIALIGFLTYEELINCQKAKKGESIKMKYMTIKASSDCYIVKYNDLHLIN